MSGQISTWDETFSSPALRLWEWKGQKRKTIDERFDEKCMPEPNSGCIIWTGSLDQKGYGLFRIGPGRTVRAHIFSYKRSRGDYTQGYLLDHLCRLKCCVNPNHLEPVTSRENTLRGVNGRCRTHCKRGHELAGENVRIFIKPNGYPQRNCKTCEKTRYKKESEAHLAA